jgi:hypothetical protein
MGELDPDKVCSVKGVLANRVDNTGEIIPNFLIDKVRLLCCISTAFCFLRHLSFICCLITQIIDDVSNALSDMRQIDPDFVGEMDDSGEHVRGAGGGVSTDAPIDVDDVSTAVSRIAAVYNFQKKRVPWQDIAWGSTVVTDTVCMCFSPILGSVVNYIYVVLVFLFCFTCVTVVCPHFQAEAAGMAVTVTSVPHQRAVLTATDARGRSCQPLVVMASLVDKAPNLGGLARTCEIFRTECLTVADLRIKVDLS